MFNDSNWKEILKEYDDPLTINNLSKILEITPKMVRKYLKRAKIDYKIMSKKFFVPKATWLKHVKSVFKAVGYASPNDMARVITRLNHMWEVGINPPLPEPSEEEKEQLNKKLCESRRIGFREGYYRGKKEKTEETIEELTEEGFTEKKIAELLNISENEVKSHRNTEKGTILQINKTS